jgi:hypothetical protein
MLRVADIACRFAKQLDNTTEVEIIKADLEERGFNIKVGYDSLSLWRLGKAYRESMLTRICS